MIAIDFAFATSAAAAIATASAAVAATTKRIVEYGCEAQRLGVDLATKLVRGAQHNRLHAARSRRRSTGLCSTARRRRRR